MNVGSAPGRHYVAPAGRSPLHIFQLIEVFVSFLQRHDYGNEEHWVITDVNYFNLVRALMCMAPVLC